MHVRICVECGEEYRPEIMICTDCGGRLEDRQDDGGARTVLRGSLPAESALDPDEAFTERILHEDRATELVKAADRLVDEGIGAESGRPSGQSGPPLRLRMMMDGVTRLLRLDRVIGYG